MSIDFATLQTNLTTWIEALVGLDADGDQINVEWGKQPQKIWTRPFILAYAGPITKLGHDWRGYAYDQQSDQQSETMYGLRLFPLRLSFRSFDQRLGRDARQYAEQFRLQIQSSNSTDFLAENFIGFVDTSDLIETDYEWSNRIVNQVDMTVTLALHLDSANAQYSGDYIDTVEVTEQHLIITEDGDPVVDENGDNVVSDDQVPFTIAA